MRCCERHVTARWMCLQPVELWAANSAAQSPLRLCPVDIGWELCPCLHGTRLFSGASATVCCAGDRVSHDSRLFTREGLSQLVQVEPLAPVPPAGALMEDYQCQLEAEGACLQVGPQECCCCLPAFHPLLPAGCQQQ